MTGSGVMGVTGVTGVMGEGCCGQGGSEGGGAAMSWLSEGRGGSGRREMGSAEGVSFTSKATSRPHTSARARLMAVEVDDIAREGRPTTSTKGRRRRR